MELRAGVIVIGSLIWDPSDKRNKWRSELDLGKKVLVKLPIRYGRKSRQDGDRKGTYTMVFSNSTKEQSKLGQGLIVPFKDIIASEQDLKKQALMLSYAEGISNKTISKEWGTVSIAINPFLDVQRKKEIGNLWDQVTNSLNTLNGYQHPNINSFGDPHETKSITDTLRLNIDLESLFSQCSDLEVLLAASNTIKLDNDGTNAYPTVKRIAATIYENNYYEYFLSNRLYSIKTFEDRKISKILKKQYRVKLKPKRESLRKNVLAVRL